MTSIFDKVLGKMKHLFFYRPKGKREASIVEVFCRIAAVPKNYRGKKKSRMLNLANLQDFFKPIFGIN
jgi:predicted RNA-binding protein